MANPQSRTYPIELRTWLSQGLLQGTLAPSAAVAPFYLLDWPLPGRSVQRDFGQWGPNLLETTLAPLTEAKTGTGGIDPVKAKRKRGVFKPTGLLDRRVEETAQIAHEVTERLKEEFLPQEAKLEVPVDEIQPIERVSLSSLEGEIAALMRKQMRTSEEEEMLNCLLLICLASV